MTSWNKNWPSETPCSWLNVSRQSLLSSRCKFRIKDEDSFTSVDRSCACLKVIISVLENSFSMLLIINYQLLFFKTCLSWSVPLRHWKSQNHVICPTFVFFFAVEIDRNEQVLLKARLGSGLIHIQNWTFRTDPFVTDRF